MPQAPTPKTLAKFEISKGSETILCDENQFAAFEKDGWKKKTAAPSAPARPAQAPVKQPEASSAAKQEKA